MPEKRGIAKLREAYNLLFDIIKEGKETYGDGFDIGDIFSSVGLLKDLIHLGTLVQEAALEAGDLEPMEAKIVVREFISKACTLFEMNSGDNQYGIVHSQIFIKSIAEVAKIVKAAIADGVQVTDVSYLPALVSEGVIIITNMEEFIQEMGDLTPDELAIILADLASRILYLVKAS